MKEVETMLACESEAADGAVTAVGPCRHKLCRGPLGHSKEADTARVCSGERLISAVSSQGLTLWKLRVWKVGPRSVRPVPSIAICPEWPYLTLACSKIFALSLPGVC